MMRATLESTTDGILVTDGARQRSPASTRSSWRCGGCPARSWTPADHRRLLEVNSRQFEDPAAVPRQGRRDLRVVAAGKLRPAGARRREGVRAVLEDPVRRRAERRPRLELSRHHRRASGHAKRPTRFLADASATLAELTDYESTLQRVASLAVPAFADWCAVDMREADGSIRRLAVTHADPSKVRAGPRAVPPLSAPALGRLRGGQGAAHRRAGVDGDDPRRSSWPA